MGYTITDSMSTGTYAGGDSLLNETRSAYASCEESATYEVPFGSIATAYAITSQICE